MPDPGDAAAALGWPIVDSPTTPANELGDEVNVSRDLAAGVHSETRPVSRGGTGATTAAGARTNLGVPATSHTHSSLSGTGGSVVTINNTQMYVNRNVGVDGGHIYVPSSSAAVSGYTVCYIDGDGRISRGASTERVKKHISPIGPSVLGDVFPELFKFQMRLGDGTWKFGYIAERLAESESLAPFVVWETEEDGKTLALDEHNQPIPLSIDFISLLIVQVAQLNVRVLALEEAN